MPIRPRLPASKTPWPMKWIALAIVAFIVPYTFLRLHYAKPGPAYEPNAEAEKRAADPAAGWARIEVRVERPADPARVQTGLEPTAKISTGSGGLPAALPEALARASALPTDISAASAAAQGSAPVAYQVLFTGAFPADQQLADVLVFQRDNRVVIIPQSEPAEGGLRARSDSTAVLLSVPAGTLKPGRYAATLVAAHGSKQWTLEIK